MIKLCLFEHPLPCGGDSGRGDCTNNIDDTIDEMVWNMPRTVVWKGKKKHEERNNIVSSFNALSPSVPLSMNSAEDNTVNWHLLMANSKGSSKNSITSKPSPKTGAPGAPQP